MEKVEPKQGELYKDDKEKIYQIVAVANYVERSEKVVVYQEMFSPYGFVAMAFKKFVQKFSLVRDIPAEVSEVQPEIEKADVVEENATDKQSEIVMDESKEEEPLSVDDSSNDYPEGVNPLLIDFLEADTIHEKVKILIDNREKVDDKCINDLAASLDISIDEGDIEVRYYQLVSCLETMRKYEVLRR